MILRHYDRCAYSRSRRVCSKNMHGGFVPSGFADMLQGQSLGNTQGIRDIGTEWVQLASYAVLQHSVVTILKSFPPTVFISRISFCLSSQLIKQNSFRWLISIEIPIQNDCRLGEEPISGATFRCATCHPRCQGKSAFHPSIDSHII